MVGWSKNIKWWWFNIGKTIEKPLMPMVPRKKNINHSIVPKKMTIEQVYIHLSAYHYYLVKKDKNN